jgi:tetratricopeptide (TPR) repeat protein
LDWHSLRCGIIARSLKNQPIEILNRAGALMKEERWREAIAFLKQNISTVAKDRRLLWNLGWCHFKLGRMAEAQRHLQNAHRLAPTDFSCMFGLGMIALKKKQYRKAESLLVRALKVRELHAARIGLALAYLEQGKIRQAEKTHLDGIRLKPNQSQRYESYAAFLWDIGREAEAEQIDRKAKQLRHIN